MAILDDQGRPTPEGMRGEICIRGRTVCAGYFRREDANEAAFQWGWFRSGDEGLYRADETGRPFFFVSGRLKELIIRGGVNISPLEIDDVLKAHRGVKFAMGVEIDYAKIDAGIEITRVPVIVGMVKGNSGKSFPLLIDGWHRAAAALEQSVGELSCMVLTARETKQIEI